MNHKNQGLTKATSRAAAVRWLEIAVLFSALIWVLLDVQGYERLLRFLVGSESSVLYPTSSVSQLFFEQLYLVVVSSVLALLIGTVLGFVALSRIGSAYRDLIVSLANLAQAIPTVAVIMLVVPLTGYGAEPVIIGLVLYSILPITLNIIVGIENVPNDLTDAARGMGLLPRQIRTLVEIPAALPVIMGGIKNMVVINISAATVGAVVSAGGFGQAILAGFGQYNTAYIFEGAIPIVLMALLADRVLTQLTTGAYLSQS